MSKNVYLLCGLPGAGKTFWAKNMESENVKRYSLDEIFLEKFGDGHSREKHDELSKNLKEEIFLQVEKDMLSNFEVILDFGFWKTGDREEVRKYFQEKGFSVSLVFFDLPKNLRHKRVLNREKENNFKINQEALDEFESRFERPDEEELTKYDKYDIVRI